MEVLDIVESIDLDSRYSYNDYIVPRVTQITSMIHDEYLMKWASSLGYRHISYETKRDEAASYGTITHNAINEYLLDKTPEETNLAYEGFLKWWEIVTKEGNQVRIIGSEESLSCPYYGGTYDLLVEINGLVYLIDFKTSNHINYKYMLQLAAYRSMIRSSKNIELGGCIILQLDKKELGFSEYLVNLSIQEHREFMDNCEVTFNQLAKSYIMVEHIKQAYPSMKFKL